EVGVDRDRGDPAGPGLHVAGQVGGVPEGVLGGERDAVGQAHGYQATAQPEPPADGGEPGRNRRRQALRTDHAPRCRLAGGPVDRDRLVRVAGQRARLVDVADVRAARGQVDVAAEVAGERRGERGAVERVVDQQPYVGQPLTPGADGRIDRRGWVL